MGGCRCKLYGHPDRHNEILTRHLPRLVEALGSDAQWWFLRCHDPDHHLRIRLTVPHGAFANAAAHVTTWCEQVRQAGLTGNVQWDTYFPETARFGGGAAMDAAETYFAADSAAALAQLIAITCPRRAQPARRDRRQPARHRRCLSRRRRHGDVLADRPHPSRRLPSRPGHLRPGRPPGPTGRSQPPWLRIWGDSRSSLAGSGGGRRSPPTAMCWRR